jgi:hypothetical protein
MGLCWSINDIEQIYHVWEYYLNKLYLFNYIECLNKATPQHVDALIPLPLITSVSTTSVNHSSTSSIHRVDKAIDECHEFILCLLYFKINVCDSVICCDVSLAVQYIYIDVKCETKTNVSLTFHHQR